MSSNSPATNSSSGSDSNSLTETGADFSPTAPPLRRSLATVPQAKANMRPESLAFPTAANVACVRGAARPPPWKTLRDALPVGG